MLPLAVSNGDVIITVVLVAVPIAAIAFAGAGSVYREIGRGSFSMDHDGPSARGAGASGGSDHATEQAEIRQMLEAKAYRQRQRGEHPLDVDDEMRRIRAPRVELDTDPALVEEVRQLVVARNQRRLRQGKEPLEVQAEVARRLRELENL